MTEERPSASEPAAPVGRPPVRRRLGRRAAALSETPAARAVRGQTRRRLDRVGSVAFEIAQTGVAAGVAWLAAQQIVGQQRPFFAPIAAVISLGLARGQPRGRAVELTLGVAVGIAVADVLVQLAGTGTVQIAVGVMLAMAAALLIGAGTLLVNQAAISALLILTLPTLGSGSVFDRFFDAIIGGAVALLLSQVLFPRDPVRSVAAAAEPLLEELATSLDEAAGALAERDVELAEHALSRARALDDEISRFYDAIAVGRETAWLSPPKRRARGHLRLYADAARQVDYAVRNIRVLARAAVAATRAGPVDPELAESVATLASAVRALAAELEEHRHEGAARQLAQESAAIATEVLASHHDLRTSMLVGQVRATAHDILRGSGLDTGEARLEARPPGEGA